MTFLILVVKNLSATLEKMQPCHSLRFARGASHNLKSHSTKSGHYLSSHLANTTPAVKDVVHIHVHVHIHVVHGSSTVYDYSLALLGTIHVRFVGGVRRLWKCMRVGKSTSVRNKLALHFVGACSLTGSNTTHHFLSIILFYFILIVAFRAKYILASNGRTTRRLEISSQPHSSRTGQYTLQ